MKRLLFILAILCAALVMSSSTAEAHRWYRGYYGYGFRVGYPAFYGRYYTGYRGYYAHPRPYYVGYPVYYGGYGGHCGW